MVRETEGVAVLAECFGEDGGHCSIAGICRLRGVLGEAVKAFYAVLDRYTLADLVHNRQSLAKVLFIEQPVAPPAVAGRPHEDAGRFRRRRPLEAKPPYPYEGPEELRQPILDALTKVVDPEVAMSIVDVGPDLRRRR